jgi:hypothetical protein
MGVERRNTHIRWERKAPQQIFGVCFYVTQEQRFLMDKKVFSGSNATPKQQNPSV